MSNHSINCKPVIPSRVQDLTDRTFGKLTVTEFAGHVQSKTQRNAVWLCFCSACQTSKVMRASSLLSGRVSSCGCLLLAKSAAFGDRVRKHGMYLSPEYAAWQNMKKRCLDSTYRRFKDYGGRGIKVCDRWLESFENFIADMGRRPSNNHSIDRKDNNGNYEPSNCEWALRPQQDSNKRTSRLVTYKDETLTLKEWSRRIGIHYNTLRQRLASGWTTEEAFETPPAMVGGRAPAYSKSDNRV